MTFIHIMAILWLAYALVNVFTGNKEAVMVGVVVANIWAVSSLIIKAVG